MLRMFPFALASLLSASSLFADTAITDGVFPIVVNDAGVLVRVSDPGAVTFDGPDVVLQNPVEEWAGVRFRGPSGVVVASASGNAVDHAGRPPMTSIDVRATPDTARSIANAAGLQVETTWSYDPDGPYVIACVVLTNTTAHTLTGIHYSREWRVARGRGFSFPPDLDDGIATPHDVARRVWMLDDLAPGASGGLGFSLVPLGAAPISVGVDVPLALFTNAQFPAPNGVPIGMTNGISFGDYDADGHIDIFACRSGNLWQNVGGTTWQLAADLDTALPNGFRYGSAFGDYDEDGLPDIGTEPRKTGPNTCFNLLRNLGGGANFLNVAPNPTIVNVPLCAADAETICWGDVDGDSDMDMFLPVYPALGNYFLENLGPTGPGNAFHFSEQSAAAGLDNPPGNARPEGAQFCDVDQDGDLDLYSNGALYQNISPVGTPKFGAMTTAGSGIAYSNFLEEGAMFFDYDLDGDMDLFAVFSVASTGVKVFEAKGDGTFFEGENSIIDSSNVGLDLGMSAEDWDFDGDIDFTTRQVFRRNQLMETGQRKFTVASHSIPSGHLTSATPAWGDTDGDGDLDCALGNWLSVGHIYENVLYSSTTPPAQRRYVRVRPVRDDPSVPRGLEVEYGTTVEIVIHGETERRRRKFTSSAGGYLNQNEYTLSFAMPPDPAPTNESEDVRFDVVCTFPSAASQGIRRVDRHVNPLLGNLNLASLADREIRVYRDGRVIRGACDFPATITDDAVTSTTTRGLVLPTVTQAPPAPTPSPTADRWVGLELDATGATQATRVTEILLDGQLDSAVPCGAESFNVALWDITAPATPFRPTGGSLALATSTRNDRTFFPVDLWLEPGHRYRLVARVTSRRTKAISGAINYPTFTMAGSLDYQDALPCSGTGVVAATVDTTKVPLAIRYRTDDEAWFEVGGGSAGANGVPALSASGRFLAGETVDLTLQNGPANAPALLVLADSPRCVGVLGGTLVPNLTILIPGAVTDGAGSFAVSAVLPPDTDPETNLWVQVFVADATVPTGIILSNAIVTP